MKKLKTHFEQVPIAVAMKVAREEALSSPTRYASCAICDAPVELERCKTDETGRAVHANCYVAKVTHPDTWRGRGKSGTVPLL